MLYLTDQSLLPQVLVLVLKNCKLAIEPFNPKTGGGVELENGFKIYRIEVVSCSVTVTTQASFFDYALIAVCTKDPKRQKSNKTNSFFLKTTPRLASFLQPVPLYGHS